MKIPGQKTIAEGLHQYVMHLYKSLISGGFSEAQAKTEVTRILLEEIKTFDPSIKELNCVKTVKDNMHSYIEGLERKLELETDEQERFKIMQRIEELKKSLA